MNDVDVKGMLKDEECRYGISCTGVNLNGMNHTVYNLRGVRLYLGSRAIYNTALCYFFSMKPFQDNFHAFIALSCCLPCPPQSNLFRCLNFADLEGFLYHVRHVHMIQRIQVAWKGGGTPIAKGIRRLQKNVTRLTELRLIVGKKDSKAMLTQPAWRLMCETTQ